jgi:hypothetical protein
MRNDELFSTCVLAYEPHYLQVVSVDDTLIARLFWSEYRQEETDYLNRSPATKGGTSDHLYRQFREELPRKVQIESRRAIPRNGTI